ncbi:MAG: HAD hydrolase family protein [Bacilli bacterium]
MYGGNRVVGVKCVVLDLDGTLLNDEKSTSSTNLLAIQSCIAIVVATARPPVR